MVLKSLQPAGENYAYRGRRSGEPSQSVTKTRQKNGEKARTENSAIRVKGHEAG